MGKPSRSGYPSSLHFLFGAGYSLRVPIPWWESLFIFTCELILWLLPIPNSSGIPQQEVGSIANQSCFGPAKGWMLVTKTNDIPTMMTIVMMVMTLLTAEGTIYFLNSCLSYCNSNSKLFARIPGLQCFISQTMVSSVHTGHILIPNQYTWPMVLLSFSV